MEFINCGHGNDFGRFEADLTWNNWKNNENSSACFSEDGFPYGIYVKAVNLTAEPSIITRYIYSSFWGFQQISTLAGNQTPSYFVWEVLFTMGITGLGLVLFALLIVNMQNFLQAFGRRRMEWLLRRHDIEQWIYNRRLPKELQRKVKESERYNWSATKGVNEEILMANFPEDLQRDIRSHIFDFFKQKVHIFKRMPEPLFDAIMERLRQKTYPKEGTPLNEGRVVKNVVFIVKGIMSSERRDGKKFMLSEGDICGEELLMRCLERYLEEDSRNQIKTEYIFSSRTVKCLTRVEAFVLQAADLEEVMALFFDLFKNKDLKKAIREWQAALAIQVTWRYFSKKRPSRAANSRNHYSAGIEEVISPLAISNNNSGGMEILEEAA